MKSLLVIIVFLSLLVLPLCYVLIKERTLNHTDVKATAPAAPVNK